MQYRLLEKTIEAKLPGWGKELDEIGLKHLKLTHLKPLYKLLIAVAILSLASSLIIILIALLYCKIASRKSQKVDIKATNTPVKED